MLIVVLEKYNSLMQLKPEQATCYQNLPLHIQRNILNALLLNHYENSKTTSPKDLLLPHAHYGAVLPLVHHGDNVGSHCELKEYTQKYRIICSVSASYYLQREQYFLAKETIVSFFCIYYTYLEVV